VELKRFFDRAVRASFDDLALRGDPAAPYLSDLLTRFARIENLYPRGTAIPRLETVVDMMMEIQSAWQVDTPDFRPEHEITVRRHIGDYTLFMTGIFPERVRSTASVGFYVSQGKQAYQFVSEHARTTPRRPTPFGGSPTLGLRPRARHTRRVHFPRRRPLLPAAPMTAADQIDAARSSIPPARPPTTDGSSSPPSPSPRR
jgi:hypothetical protein